MYSYRESVIDYPVAPYTQGNGTIRDRQFTNTQPFTNTTLE